MNRSSPALLGLAGLWVLAILVVVWPQSGPGPSMVAGWLGTTGPALLAAGALLGAAWGPGAWIGGWLLRRPLSDWPSQLLIELAVGLAALQSLAVLAGGFGLLKPTLGPVCLIIGLLLGVLRLRSEPPSWSPLSSDVLPWVALTGAIALLLPTLFSLGAPPTGADELQYHLRLPRSMLESGTLSTDPQDPVSAFPRGLHVLLALGFGLGGEGIARALAWLLGLLAIMGGHRIAMRLGGPTAGALALLITCGATSLVRTLPVVSTDVPLGLFVSAAILLLLSREQDMHPLDARLACGLGLIGGAAFSIKYTAALYLAPVWVGAIWVALRQRRPSTVLALAASALLPLLFVAPWWAANAAAGLHPLYPIQGITAPEGLEAAFRFNQTENYGAGPGFLSWVRTPWDLFALGTEFDRRHFLGRLGAWPLFALPGILLALRRVPVRLVAAIALCGFALWAGPLRRVPYLLPLWPTIAALCGVGFAELLPARRSVRLGATLAIGLIAAAEVGPAWSSALADADVSTGRKAPNEVIDERAESARAWRWIRDHVPAGETIVAVYTWEVLAPSHHVIWACAEECPIVRLQLFEAGNGAGAVAMLGELGSRWMLVKQQPFVRSGYPGLSDAQFEAGYAMPARVLDELTGLHGTERFRAGRYTVFEFPEVASREK